MEGLTLLSLSRWDQCVYYWTGYITQTRRHACDVHTFGAKNLSCLESMQTYTHTHKEHIKMKYTCSSRDIHTYAQAIHIWFTPHHPPYCVLWLCLHVCVCAFTCVCASVCVPASESVNALMTTVLTQVFWLLPLSIGTLTDMWLVTLGWKTREAHTVTMKETRGGLSPVLSVSPASSFFKSETSLATVTGCVIWYSVRRVKAQLGSQRPYEKSFSCRSMQVSNTVAQNAK